jgi:dethiobiotin synthetase
MKTIYITATNTDVGKTYTTLKLLDQFASMGYRVGAIKPIESGVDNSPLDATLLYKKSISLNRDFKTLSINDICPIQLQLPAAPYIAKESHIIDFNLIKQSLTKVEQLCDIVLIESAGGLMTPIEIDTYMIDLVDLLNIDTTLLITHDKLGCISDTLTNLSLLKSKNISHIWAINHRNYKSFEQITLPFYKDKFQNLLSVQNNIKTIAQLLITNCNSNRNLR